MDDTLGGYLTNLRYTDKEGNLRHQFEVVPEKGESTYTNTNTEMVLEGVGNGASMEQ